MKKTILLTALVLISFIYGGCDKDYLDRPPLDEISSEVFFRTTTELELYINQFYKPGILEYGGSGGLNYSKLIFEADLNSDNYIGIEINPTLHGTRVVPASGGAWNYTSVRNINYFFDNYRKCEDDFDKYKQFVGEAHFFRAVIYFSLLRQFGDVQWYEKTLQVNSPELYDPRTSRNQIVDNLLADLDSAAMYLTADRNIGGTRLDKWGALALQSRIALYEGSWERYHAGTAFGVTNPNPEKYFSKAAASAKAIMESGKFEIYNTGNPSKDYYNFFNLHDYASNKEVILWKKFDKALGIVNYRMISGWFPRGTGITKALADSYLCTDGRPVSISSLFKGHGSITNEVANRDPRYAQTIFTPDAPYKTSIEGVINWNEGVYSKLYSSSDFSSTTGYVMRKGYSDDVKTHNLAGEDEPIIIYDFAEVLLNYAEAKAELGTITQNDIDISIKSLRDRAGMPNLVLSDIPADPRWDFPGLSPIINEVRRERRVELALVGFRWNDIARWAAADELIVGQRPKGIRYGAIFPNNPYPKDNDGFMDPYKVQLPNGYGFNVKRDYLSPLPVSELTLNKALKQNPGW